MSPKKNLLIPLDGTGFSLSIIESVKNIFSPDNFKLIVLCVEPVPTGQVSAPRVLAGPDMKNTMHLSHRDAVLEQHPVYTSQEEASVEAEVRYAFSKIVKGLSSEGYDVKMEVLFGEPANSILNYVETGSVDLIALTTHSRTGVGRMLFGSVASRLIRESGLPVLALHPKSVE